MKKIIKFKGSLDGSGKEEYYTLASLEENIEAGTKVLVCFQKFFNEYLEIESIKNFDSKREILSGIDKMDIELIFYQKEKLLKVLPSNFKRIGFIIDDNS